MLTYLSIKNVVLIEALTIEFQNGFCALTGETGAGKSILLDSLGLALGARSDAGLIRKGADQAAVSVCFDLPKDHAAHMMLQENGLESEDGQIVMRRVVSLDGRSRAFVNDQPVSIALLKEFGQTLVEIHGQFETQGLLDPKTHRLLLDSFAGVSAIKLQEAWVAWSTAEQAVVDAQNAIEDARREEDYLRQSLEDLDTLSPEKGEEEKLSDLRQRLMSRDQVIEALNNAYNFLGAEDSGSEHRLGQAYSALDRISDKLGASGDTILQALDRAASEMQEAIALIQSLSADMEAADDNLEDIDDRLHDLRAQARKHGCVVDELPDMRQKIAAQLSQIQHQDDIIASLIKTAQQAKAGYVAIAKDSSAKRKAAASRLDKGVMAELVPLKLERARFVSDVKELPEEQWGVHGMDQVRFLVATNPGREAGPLNKIASGGEMARFMLALKVVLAESGGPQTLVFDEVDTGIGGSTAAAVGERLLRLAQSKQILIVTHSPQVAARAGHHFIVMKGGEDDIRTNIITLDKAQQRREEIARMLSGEHITEESRAAADKLLETGS